MSDLALLREAQREKRMREGLPLRPTILVDFDSIGAEAMIARAVREGRSIEDVLVVVFVEPVFDKHGRTVPRARSEHVNG